MANRKPFPDGLLETSGLKCVDAGEMMSLGAEFGRAVEPGAVVSLEGPLGAGKTHFAKGVAAGVGYDGDVSSPTFTLVHEYVGGRMSVSHFDFYRLEDAEELVNLGFDDYLDGSGVVLIEWGDRFPEVIPRNAWRVRIEVDGTARLVEVSRST